MIEFLILVTTTYVILIGTFIVGFLNLKILEQIQNILIRAFQ
jgi:hypothetical protein